MVVVHVDLGVDRRGGRLPIGVVDQVLRDLDLFPFLDFAIVSRSIDAGCLQEEEGVRLQVHRDSRDVVRQVARHTRPTQQDGVGNGGGCEFIDVVGHAGECVLP